MKRILIGTVAMIMAMPCFAEDTPATGDKRITSKPYVDNAVATRQDKIPAANLSNTNYGETVMTYTPNGDGEIGERALFTGGEYDASTDADKLITASALNTAFTNLPTTDTTKLVCANQSDGCTLWTITNQTAYGVSSGGTTTVDLSALLNVPVAYNCYKQWNNGAVATQNGDGDCTSVLEKYGDWGAVFVDDNATVQISGISVCSSLNPGGAYGPITSAQEAVVQNSYINVGAGSSAYTSTTSTRWCYCKMTYPAESGWIYVDAASPRVTGSFCSQTCASRCGTQIDVSGNYKSALFGN